MSHPTKRYPKPLNDNEVMMIADTIRNSRRYIKNRLGEFLRLRDSTAWLLMNYAGLRPGECLKLKWTDIDFNKRMIRLSPYWNKVRIDIPAMLTKPAERLIINYRKQLEEIGILCIYLFPSVQSWQPLTTERYGDVIRNAGKECGIAEVDWYTESGQPKYNLRPYSARHNFLTRVYKATGSEIAVMKLGRHLSQESAQFYVHLNDEDKLKIADEIFK